jgi:single-strand DNA-binding protein
MVSRRPDQARLGQEANEVRLVGRLAAAVETRRMPSGDEAAVFRLVVDRPLRSRGPSGRVRVDALDCVAWRSDLRRRLGSLAPGTELEVSGAVRRRFWRGPGGAASRVEIEVDRLRRVRVPR